MRRSLCCFFFLASFWMQACMALASNTGDGVAVVGCGVLGTSLCKQLLEAPAFAHCSVTGITKTTSRHEEILEQVGASERFTVQTADAVEGKRFKNVVFCAPPSGFEDYPGAVENAASNLWDSEMGGSFVFTSSGGIYVGKDGETVTESSPTADPESSPRVARLVRAEQACQKHGGTCLRLAGLYNLRRGAHNFWLTSSKSVSGRPDGVINLLHYDDAASACVAALASRPAVWLVSDGNPTTRKGICQSALKAKPYQGMSMPVFAGTSSDPIGKIYDGSHTNKVLKWKPKYNSFDDFMSSQS